MISTMIYKIIHYGFNVTKYSILSYTCFIILGIICNIIASRVGSEIELITIKMFTYAMISSYRMGYFNRSTIYTISIYYMLINAKIMISYKLRHNIRFSSLRNYICYLLQLVSNFIAMFNLPVMMALIWRDISYILYDNQVYPDLSELSIIMSDQVVTSILIGGTFNVKILYPVLLAIILYPVLGKLLPYYTIRLVFRFIEYHNPVDKSISDYIKLQKIRNVYDVKSLQELQERIINSRYLTSLL